MRDHAMQIFEAAVNAVRPEKLIPFNLNLEGNKLCIGKVSYDLNNLRHIYLVAAGKAAAAMTLEAEKVLGNFITEAIVVTKDGHSLPIKSSVIESAHPVPDERSLYAGKQVLELLVKANSDDLVILLLSGGASSLLEFLPGQISLPDLQELSNLMLKKGLTIGEMNTIRKHLSRIKGGQFSLAASPAKVHALILSDVPGDDLSVIASGLTVPDPSTFADAYAILENYQLINDCPSNILEHFHNGLNGIIEDTPMPGDSIFDNTINQLIGSNSIALNAAADRALQLGYNALIVNADLKGEASEQAVLFVEKLLTYNGPKPACFLMGGETTVTIRGDGLGGRNQEFALASIVALQNIKTNASNKKSMDVEESGTSTLSIAGSEGFKIPIILSAGTDGSDGPTDATGAIIDNQTLQIIRDQNLNSEEYLQRNDSYNFFKTVGGHIITGPTQTNVMDIVIGLIY
ncbi:MAG: glycerate kinase type-2 family protein [Flavitalea sp.]